MKQLKFGLKISFSGIIIVFILWKKVDLGEIAAALGQTHFKWVIFSYLLHPIGLLISSYRWQILLRAQSISIRLATLFQSYLVCSFFNLFLPTRVGGDLIRAYDTKLLGHSGVKSLAIVFVERVSGLLMLLIFTCVVSVVRLVQGSPDPLYWAGLVIGLSGFLGVLVICHPVPFKVISMILNRLQQGSIAQKLAYFQEIIVSYREQGRQKEFLQAFFLAFLLQLNVIIHYYLLGRAFNIHTHFGFSEWFVIVPLVQVILMFPLAINGIGLREISWLTFFERFGILSGIAVAFSVLDFAMTLSFGVIGGIIYALRK